MKSNRNRIKLLSMLLALMMLLPAFSACSQTPASTVAPSTAAPETTAANTTEAPQESATPAPNSWDLDKTPVTLDWYTNLTWANTRFDPAASPVAKLIVEKTGVTLNCTTPTADATEMLTTMIAADNLPDILSISASDPLLPQMESGGKLAALNELIPQYASGFDSIIPKSMKDFYQYDDGKWYAFPGMYYAPEEMEPGIFIRTNSGMIARQDIMTQLGLTADDFKTYDGFFTALKKVKDANLKVGDQDVTPIYIGDGVIADLVNLQDMFAVALEDKDGNLLVADHSPRYMDMLTFANKLYTEGYMPLEAFTASRDQIQEKMATGTLFAVIGNMGNYGFNAQTVFAGNKDIKYVPVGPVKAADGKAPVLASISTKGWIVSCISSRSQKKDRAIRFFNFCYDREGTDLFYWGIEGQTYTIKDGRYYYTDEVATTAEGWSKYFTWDANPGWMYDPILVEDKEVPPPQNDIDQMLFDIQQYFGKDSFDEAAWLRIAPPNGTDEASIYSQIDVYRQKMLPQIIMAKTPEELKTLYDEMIQHEDELGFQKVYTMMNERFKANKQKLGVQLAWPQE
jgi:putative aldouronate transport system substrate-binding protein